MSPHTARHLFAGIVAFGSLAVIAAPAIAQTGSKGEAEAREAAGERGKSDKLKLVCRTESVIGSRAKKKRTCLTKEQWEAVAANGNRYSRGLVEGGRSGMCFEGCN